MIKGRSKNYFFFFGGLLQIFAVSQFRVFVCVTYSIINRFFYDFTIFEFSVLVPGHINIFWSPAISTYFGPGPYRHILVPRPYRHILVPGHIDIFWSPAISTYFGPGPYQHILVLGHINIFWSPAISTYFGPGPY